MILKVPIQFFLPQNGNVYLHSSERRIHFAHQDIQFCECLWLHFNLQFYTTETFTTKVNILFELRMSTLTSTILHVLKKVCLLIPTH